MNLKGKVLSMSVSEFLEEALWASGNNGASLVYAGSKTKLLSFGIQPSNSNTPIEFNDIPMDLVAAKKIATAFETGQDVELTLSVK